MNRRFFFAAAVAPLVVKPVEKLPELPIKERVDVYLGLMSRGYLTVNQVRAMENLPPIEPIKTLHLNKWVSNRELRKAAD